MKGPPHLPPTKLLHLAAKEEHQHQQPTASHQDEDEDKVAFCVPYMTGQEVANIKDAMARGMQSDTEYTRLCHEWLEASLTGSKAFLTQSCTSALEMAAVLANIKPGDEVIMPSYTFVSSANAFVLRGATVVFVDIRPDTLNLDERKVEAAITSRSKAILVVHYGGVGAEMDELLAIARRHDLLLIEDAAHAIQTTYKGRPLGGIGDMSTFSFHYTKNIISGEGGAIVVRRPDLQSRGYIVWEKGTNRHQFKLGKIDRYSWVDVGSSFLPSEITAAFLYAQLCHATEINSRRMQVWERYHEGLKHLEDRGLIRRPVVPEHCKHNGHLYYILIHGPGTRAKVQEAVAARGVQATTHYVPLHAAPGGLRFGRVHGEMKVTNRVYEELLRLPLWPHMPEELIDKVIEEVARAVNEHCCHSS